MKQVIEGVRYDTEAAQVVATDRYWDGSNWDRRGRNKTLYKSPRGRFFVHHETMWQGEFDHLEPVTAETAKELYERLHKKELEYEDAFGVQPEEA